LNAWGGEIHESYAAFFGTSEKREGGPKGEGPRETTQKVDFATADVFVKILGGVFDDRGEGTKNKRTVVGAREAGKRKLPTGEEPLQRKNRPKGLGLGRKSEKKNRSGEGKRRDT